MEGRNIKEGQRMDVLNIRNDVKRTKVIKMIIENQTSADKNSYVVVGDDPRFGNDEPVPFPAAGGTRPILVDDNSYRTTFIRQVFN